MPGKCKQKRKRFVSPGGCHSNWLKSEVKTIEKPPGKVRAGCYQCPV
jgi:hypothetical protein